MKNHKLASLLSELQSGVACGERSDNGIIQIRMNNVSTTGILDLKNHIRIPRNFISDKMILQFGDVLFNNTNSVYLVGKSALFQGYTEQITFSNHFTRLRPYPKLLIPEYLTYWLNHLWHTRYFESICDRWIGQAAIQRKKIESLEIFLPTIQEQCHIATRLKAQLAEVEKACKATETQLSDIRKLPNQLLAQAFET